MKLSIICVVLLMATLIDAAPTPSPYIPWRTRPLNPKTEKLADLKRKGNFLSSLKFSRQRLIKYFVNSAVWHLRQSSLQISLNWQKTQLHHVRKFPIKQFGVNWSKLKKYSSKNCSKTVIMKDACNWKLERNGKKNSLNYNYLWKPIITPAPDVSFKLFSLSQT